MRPVSGIDARKEAQIRTGAVQALMQPCEWHHTSKEFNATDYYDGKLLLLVQAGAAPCELEAWDDADLAEARDLLEKLRAWRPAKHAEQVWRDCKNEDDQSSLYERLKKEGRKCRLLADGSEY